MITRVAAISLVGLAALSSPDVALACERCFGAGSDSPVVAAISLSMFTLLVVVSVVMTGITKFFTHSARRAKLLDEFGFDERTSGDGN